MFERDRSNLRKVRGHRIKRKEAEQALYGETDLGRLLAVVLTERHDNLRVITAYDLDTGRKARLFRKASAGRVNLMKKGKIEAPRFNSMSEEADWWASGLGAIT